MGAEMNSKPFTFWIRNDAEERLRREPNMTALLNELLAKHYSLAAVESDPREFRLVLFTLNPAGAVALRGLQTKHRWSKDHVSEMAIRANTGMPAPARSRYTRRVPTRTVCQHQVLLHQSVVNALRAVTDKHPNKDASTGPYLSEWIVKLAKQLSDEESGL